MAKHRITQTMPHDSPGILVFWCRKSLQNSNGVTPNGGARCRWGKIKCRCGSCRLATFDAKHCHLSSVARLSHWASTFVCGTFAVMQHIARVCHRQLILVLIVDRSVCHCRCPSRQRTLASQSISSIATRLLTSCSRLHVRLGCSQYHAG